jgi:hypothetical protein
VERSSLGITLVAIIVEEEERMRWSKMVVYNKNNIMKRKKNSRCYKKV